MPKQTHLKTLRTNVTQPVERATATLPTRIHHLSNRIRLNILPGYQVISSSLGLVLTLLLTFSCKTPSSTNSDNANLPLSGSRIAKLYNIYEDLNNNNASMALEYDKILSESLTLDDTDPNWPTVTFVIAEIELSNGNARAAKAAFRSLAVWGSSKSTKTDSHNTGNVLATIGLWRWLRMLATERHPRAREVETAIDVARELENDRFYRRIVDSQSRGSGLLPTLPQLKGAIARTLARLAWKTKHPLRRMLFWESLKVSNTPELPTCEEQLLEEELISEGSLDEESTRVAKAIRVLQLVRPTREKHAALRVLKEIWDNHYLATDLRCEAGYNWCYYNRFNSRQRTEMIGLLSQVLEIAMDDEVAQLALFRRAMMNAGHFDLFQKDLRELIRRYPRSSLRDDALYQLAMRAFAEGRIEKSIEIFQELRSLEIPHDREDESYIIPAIALIRGYNLSNKYGDNLQDASNLLTQYIENYPNGVFRLRALFWRGRATEAQGSASAAASDFEQVVRDAPYSYYSFRAQMHLESGIEARAKALPEPKSQIYSKIRSVYSPDAVDTSLQLDSAYHQRLYTRPIEV